jgi:large subunit ribosomal protein L35
MPKLKTKRGAAKRFRRTASGKIVRRRAFKSHLLTGKAPQRKRRLRQEAPIARADQARLRRMLPYD